MNIVILAAGLGKRMYSHLPKVLQPVGGKAMLKHVVEAARRLPDAGKIIVVVGHGSEEVKEAMADQGSYMKRFRPASQGRAHAFRHHSCHITVVVGEK